MCRVSVHGNNATAASPAIAPGADEINVAAFAKELGQELRARGLDPRVTRHIPAMDAPYFQAGLAGYSDAAMRIIARRHGCPLAVTEALLDRMLLGGGRGFDKADLQLLAEAIPSSSEDQPLLGQIIGSDPDEMAAAALKMIEQAARGDKVYRAMAYPEGQGPTSTDPRWKGHATDSAGSSGAADIADAADACEDDCTPAALLALANQQPPEQYDPRAVTLPARPSARSGAPRGTHSANAISSAGATVNALQTASASPATATNNGPGLTYASIDVNLACPVKKIDRKSRGGHWLREPQGALEILKAVRQAVPAHVPCTVKLRRAYDDTPEMARNFEVIFVGAYELGYAFATVHARTVEQKYIGPSRWTFLKDLCERHGDKPVFGSGDVWNVHDIFRMIAYTGVSAVSVARGCIGNPWIFHQARQMLAGDAPTLPTIAQQRAVLHEHFALSVALNGEQNAGRMMRKFGIKFAQHHPQREQVQHAFIAVSALDSWKHVLDEWYAG